MGPGLRYLWAPSRGTYKEEQDTIGASNGCGYPQGRDERATTGTTTRGTGTKLIEWER